MAIESTNNWEVKNKDHLDSQYKDHTLVTFDLYNGNDLRVHVDWDVPSELILNDPAEYDRLYQTKINETKSDWLMEQDNG